MLLLAKIYLLRLIWVFKYLLRGLDKNLVLVSCLPPSRLQLLLHALAEIRGNLFSSKNEVLYNCSHEDFGQWLLNDLNS